jgi:hypothetical protein
MKETIMQRLKQATITVLAPTDEDKVRVQQELDASGFQVAWIAKTDVSVVASISLEGKLLADFVELFDSLETL